MFKGIYNVHLTGLLYSAVKIIPKMSKNRAQQFYLILKYGEFCDFFNKTPEKFTLKALRYGNLCTSSQKSAALGIAGTSSALPSLARAVVQPM